MPVPNAEPEPLPEIRTETAATTPTKPLGRPEALPEVSGAESPAEMVNLKSVRGQVHASLLSGVAEAIEASPEDAVRVVRAWLHEG